MNIVVVAGGTSTERDVSLVSGRDIYKALKENGHNAILLDVYMGYKGDISDIFTMDYDWTKAVCPVSEKAPDIEEVKKMRGGNPDVFFGPNVIDICLKADIVYMGLHGDCGENGKIQSVFDLYGIKYTGTDAFSSALAMDKAVSKTLFAAAGVSTPKGHVIFSMEDSYEPKYPCVVKVCNGGSSVGVYMAANEQEYKDALKEAFEYEGKILVEDYIKGREFTCCVLDNKALPIVEIIPKEGFYNYKNKYQAGATTEICPAKVSSDVTKKIQEEAVKAYNALGIKTYARMDFIMDENEHVYCLEANTLPGMTPTSLIPQEAAAVGISYNELCDKIVKISMEKY